MILRGEHPKIKGIPWSSPGNVLKNLFSAILRYITTEGNYANYMCLTIRTLLDFFSINVFYKINTNFPKANLISSLSKVTEKSFILA